MLEHEADMARSDDLVVRDMFSPSSRTSPLSWNSSPAMIRSSVVLPEPEGPEQGDEFAGRGSPGRCRASACVLAETLGDVGEVRINGLAPCVHRGGVEVEAPFEQRLEQPASPGRAAASKRRDGKGADISRTRCRESRHAAAACWFRREYAPKPPTPRRTRPSPAHCTAARRKVAPSGYWAG